MLVFVCYTKAVENTKKCLQWIKSLFWAKKSNAFHKKNLIQKMLRAVTVEQPSTNDDRYQKQSKEEEYGGTDLQRRRSVTFADASTGINDDDDAFDPSLTTEQRVNRRSIKNNGYDTATNVYDDYDNEQQQQRSSTHMYSKMSSFTKRAIGPRLSIVGSAQNTLTNNIIQRRQQRLSSSMAPSASDIERDEKELSMKISSSTYKNYSKWRKMRKKMKETCRAILDNKVTSIFMTLATLWALFGDDVRVLAFPIECDEIFVGIAISLIVLFVLELIMSCFSKGRKYIFGFYFWLDFVACLSLLMDVPEFMTFVGMDPCEGTDSYGTGLEGEEYDASYGTKSNNSGDIARAGRASRAGTRAGRLVRVVRLIRVVNSYSSLQQKKVEKDRRLSIARSSLISNNGFEQVRKSSIQSIESVASSASIHSAKNDPDFDGTIPLVKKNSLTQAAEEFDDMSDDDLEQSRVGERLSELSTRRVIVGVLLMLFMLPIFGSEYFKASTTLIDGGLKIVHESARFDETDEQARLGFFQSLNRYYDDTNKEMYRLVVNGTSYEKGGNFSIDDASQSDPLSYLFLNLSGLQYPKLRCEAFEFAMFSGEKTENEKYDNLSFAFFDVSKEYKLQAILNIAKTVFVCIVLLLGALLFSKDANELVLRPIERMVLKVQAMAANPLTKFAIRPEDDADDDGEQFETRMLENSIARICSLLSVGFGEAGTAIIAENMKRGGDINPMVPGRKVVAIFGFCDIRQFTDSTEVLQEGVMEYVNTIGKIVHMEAHLYGGSANKNIGDAFLLVWKFPSKISMRDVDLACEGLLKDKEKLAALEQVADGALVSFLAVMAGLRRSAKLSTYKSNEKLNKRMPNFETKMGFGLHVGWAIEGAIGSEYKVDASYLSPNVNISARLEAATKQFDTPLLFTGQFANILSKSTRAKCRQIDHVTVKGSEQPLRLFTCDADIEAIPLPTQVEISSGRSYEDETNSFEFYADPFLEHPDVALMREGVSNEFLSDFESAFQKYESGDWNEAKNMLLRARKRVSSNGEEIEDGPTKSLLAVMEKTNYRAPSDWKGYRALTDK